METLTFTIRYMDMRSGNYIHNEHAANSKDATGRGLVLNPLAVPGPRAGMCGIYDVKNGALKPRKLSHQTRNQRSSCGLPSPQITP